MFLTRAYLNPRKPGALRLLGNPQRIHAAVLAGFPEPMDQPGDRVLWRLDTDNPVRPILWIVSPYEPDFTHLMAQAGWPTLSAERQWQTRDYTPLLDRLETGQQYAFRLTANPTRSLREEKGKRGKRVQHSTVHHQIQWLLGVGATAGFIVRPSTAHLPGTDEPALDLRLTHRERTVFRKGPDANAHRITIARVGYLGTLEVTDPDALRRTLTHGLGRAKGYGCGLMTLAPA